VTALAMLAAASVSAIAAPGSLLIFAGAASKPPLEEIMALYEKETGVKVQATIGGSGYVLSQMKLARQGDVFFPGSSDYMEKAKRDSAVLPETERKVVYLVSAINVQKGNPLGIKSLTDLTRSGVRVAIANPQTVCVGAYAVEIIENSLSPSAKAALRKNIVNYTESCEKTATAVSLKTVDAVIGWSVFAYWDTVRIETVPLKPEQVQRVGYIPIAVSVYTKDKSGAQRFIDYVLSEKGRAVFRKHHYFMTAEEAGDWIGAKKPVGGEYALPDTWVPK